MVLVVAVAILRIEIQTSRTIVLVEDTSDTSVEDLAVAALCRVKSVSFTRTYRIGRHWKEERIISCRQVHGQADRSGVLSSTHMVCNN